MELQKSKTALKLFSYLFVIYAMYNIVCAIVDCFRGEYSIPAVAANNGLSVTAAVVIVAVSLSLTVISFCIELFLGIRGIYASEGMKYGGAHIVLARVVLVIVIFLLLTQALAVFINISAASVDDWLGLVSAVVGTLIVIGYLIFAKKLRENY